MDHILQIALHLKRGRRRVLGTAFDHGFGLSSRIGVVQVAMCGAARTGVYSSKTQTPIIQVGNWPPTCTPMGLAWESTSPTRSYMLTLVVRAPSAIAQMPLDAAPGLAGISGHRTAF